jgi:hypothetical protein
MGCTVMPKEVKSNKSSYRIYIYTNLPKLPSKAKYPVKHSLQDMPVTPEPPPLHSHCPVLVLQLVRGNVPLAWHTQFKHPPPGTMLT